ncbi:hypothetical protein CE91St36_23360 [Christensenellaceae bacterium]|nr:hypothetical protein CE91St36_23360 [Christensenellaceae bacterium]BDF62184.1 hypothetical protein CE91St37_23340 [Christensenellaceae bacterium]
MLEILLSKEIIAILAVVIAVICAICISAALLEHKPRHKYRRPTEYRE